MGEMGGSSVSVSWVVCFGKQKTLWEWGAVCSRPCELVMNICWMGDWIINEFISVTSG